MIFKRYMHIERFGTDEVEGIELGTCYCFPKLDGTNGSVWLDNNIVKAGSRNRELTLEKDNQGFYAYILQQENIKSFLLKYPNYRLVGEWLKSHSLKTYRDDAWNKFYVFDIIEEQGETFRYLTYDEYKPLLEKYNIEYIPCLKIIKNGTYEDFINVLNSNNYLIKDGQGVGEGCFRGDARVLMADESQKAINKIKVGDLVKSYNIQTNTIENKKVTKIAYNGKKSIDQWIKCCLFPRGYSSRGFNNKAFIITNNHKCYNDNNIYKKFQDVKFLFHYEDIIDDYRYQAILGLIMSDGCISNRKMLHFSQKYGPKSEELKKVFEPFLNKSYLAISGKNSEIEHFTFNKKYIIDITNKFYKNNYQDYINIAPKLDEIGWAYLFMGNGYGAKNGSIEISIASFTKEQAKCTLKSLNKFFHINGKLSIDNRVKNGYGFRIRTSKNDGIKFLKRISKYILPAFRYKLKNICNMEEFEPYPNIQKGLKKRKIWKRQRCSLYPQFKKCLAFSAYDIEVEDNHNYFIEKCLVHNCVIKNYQFKNRFGRITWAKIVTSEFREKHIKEMGSSEITRKMVEEEIVNTYVTQAFVDKTFEKIKNESGWNSKRIPQLFSTIYHDLINEESWHIIKKFNNPTINFKTLSHFVISKVKELKKEIF